MNTAVDVEVVDLSDLETDLGRSCEYWTDGCCERQATWAGWCAHGSLRCPDTAYLCGPHKQASQEEYRKRTTCSRCDVPLTGLLSDYMRFIKL